jgi:hypothetical protein
VTDVPPVTRGRVMLSPAVVVAHTVTKGAAEVGGTHLCVCAVYLTLIVDVRVCVYVCVSVGLSVCLCA